MVFETIAKLIAERNDCDVSEITMDSTFADLSLDSMDIMEMVVQLEESIGQEIDLTEPVETIGELVNFIEGKTGAEA